MAAQLNFNIGQQNFELVRDRVAIIVKEELDNQATRQTNTELTGNVFIERFDLPNEDEGTVITVNVDQCQYDNQTAISQSNETRLNIDVYCDSYQTESAPGYERSGKKAGRLAGLIRAILQNPVYDRLKFANGIVERRSVSSIRFARVSDEQDARFTRMARIELVVRVNETVTGISPIVADGYDTQIRIAETSKGYKLTYNNE
jgi:hypothetical protein